MNYSILDVNAFDAHMENLANAFQAFRKKLLSHMADSKTRRNTLRTIYSLPAEILGEITMFVIHDPDAALDIPARIRTLSLVSRTWHNIVDNTPEAWSHFCLSSPLTFRETALRKSKSASLTVSHPARHHWDSRNVDYTGVNHQVISEIHRWESVVLDAKSLDETLIKGLAQPAPRLRYFWLSNLTFGPQTPEVELFGGEAPLLRQIHLDKVPIHMGSETLQRLHTLQLVFPDQTGPTTAEILGIVSNCPDLEWLFLVAHNPPPSGTRIAQTPLPKLHHLTLRGLDPDMTRSLLKSISAPECYQLHFDCIFQETPSTLDLPSEECFSAHFPQIARLLRRATAGEVNDPGRSSIEFHVGRNREGFGVGFKQCDLLAALGWLDKIKACRTLTPIEVTFETTPAGDPEILSLLDDHFFVTAIGTASAGSGPDDDDVRLLAYLREPKIVEGKLKWPFMRLGDFGLWCCDVPPQALLEMVQRRYGQLEESSPGWAIPVKLPQVFWRIDVGRGWQFAPESRTAVEDVVGAGVVIWNEEEV